MAPRKSEELVFVDVDELKVGDQIFVPEEFRTQAPGSGGDFLTISGKLRNDAGAWVLQLSSGEDVWRMPGGIFWRVD